MITTAMTIYQNRNEFIKQMSKTTFTMLFMTILLTRMTLKKIIKRFIITTLKTTNHEMMRKIMIISMFILYHLSKLLIIHAFDAIQFLFFAISFSSTYAMNVERTQQLITITQKKIL